MDEPIKKKGCVGIDETNHGRFPEIYTGVHSNYPGDSITTIGLKKERNKGNIQKILKDREFIYIVIPKEYKKLVNSNNIRLIAICEFIKFFRNNYLLEELLFFIDGECREKELKKLDLMLYPEFRPNMIIEPKADTTYPIVNIADHISHLIYRQYTKSKNLNNYYKEKIITPRIEDYIKIINSNKSRKETYFRIKPSTKKR